MMPKTDPVKIFKKKKKNVKEEGYNYYFSLFFSFIFQKYTASKDSINYLIIIMSCTELIMSNILLFS